MHIGYIFLCNLSKLDNIFNWVGKVNEDLQQQQLKWHKAACSSKGLSSFLRWQKGNLKVRVRNVKLRKIYKYLN